MDGAKAIAIIPRIRNEGNSITVELLDMPITLCKDCKHYAPDINFCNSLETHNICDDFFCYDGVRRS